MCSSKNNSAVLISCRIKDKNKIRREGSEGSDFKSGLPLEESDNQDGRAERKLRYHLQRWRKPGELRVFFLRKKRESLRQGREALHLREEPGFGTAGEAVLGRGNFDFVIAVSEICFL